MLTAQPHCRLLPAAWLAEMLRLINQARAAAGVRAVCLESRLIAASQAHSDDQAIMRRMSHTGSDGAQLSTRINRLGYQYFVAGECVAGNFGTVQSVFDAWMRSPPHKEKILMGEFQQMGAGRADIDGSGLYWTLDLAMPVDTAGCLQP